MNHIAVDIGKKILGRWRLDSCSLRWNVEAGFCEQVDGSSFVPEEQRNVSTNRATVSLGISYYFWRDFSYIFTLMNKPSQILRHIWY